MRKKDIKGFTLVELLAVIVILAIIMIIATMNVGKVITRSRTQSFESNMDLAVKNAKRILDTGDTLTTEKLRQSLGYSVNEYDFEVYKAVDGYILKLISNSTGKFKNVDFDTINCDSNDYICTENASGVQGKNIISTMINTEGSTVKIANDTVEEKIAKEELPSGCTSFTKKENYEVGDIISFCNYYAEFNGIKGKSEDFYVIKDNGDTVSALAKYNLMVGDSATNSYATSFPGLQANGIAAYPVAFAKKDENNKSGSGTFEFYLGYWANSIETKPLEKYGTSYPADVYDENSILYEHVQKYKKYFTSTLNKSTVNMRLITLKDLSNLGCNLENSNSPSCENIKFINEGASYWTSVARDNKYLWRMSNLYIYQIFYSESQISLRPVITISKSEL